MPLVEPSPEFRHNGVVKLRRGGPGPAVAGPSTPVGDVVTGSTADGQTRRAIIKLLLEGPITAGQIGERLGISAAGVRRHLDALIEAGDAQASAAAAWQHTGRGRPAKRYRLTAAGRAKLGHSYDDLAVAAIRQLREIGGKEAVRTFARRRIDTILAGVSAGSGDVAQTAERVADAMTRAGYATTTAPVSGPIRGVQICQHHCPVSHVAEEFPELCETEREAFAEILGTHVQRLATIVNGDCACTTHVPLDLDHPPGEHALNREQKDHPKDVRSTARPRTTTPSDQGAST
nr:metalloregulator ArsR/SmtB family transcription factor [Mycolicibacterium goodii]